LNGGGWGVQGAGSDHQTIQTKTWGRNKKSTTKVKGGQGFGGAEGKRGVRGSRKRKRARTRKRKKGRRKKFLVFTEMGGASPVSQHNCHKMITDINSTGTNQEEECIARKSEKEKKKRNTGSILGGHVWGVKTATSGVGGG